MGKIKGRAGRDDRGERRRIYAGVDGVHCQGTAARQVHAYRELAELFDFFAGFRIAPFDAASAIRFGELRTTKIRIGTSDLKIAAIAFANDALLLTANHRDFEQVPGLRFANWMDG